MKKSFLTSVAILAATLSADASAALPETVLANLPEAKVTQQDLQAQNPFVLERPNENGLFVAAHGSHVSHRSHVSSR
jgi:hypothetical protein